ncbi:MAG TPA: anhydro-N-acetylmuramic acid kinase [Bacteroidales bacterium]|nr:anhydro-N-acetylmuramic acid kinase [Bacteroidales bacterium]
MKQYYNVIGLMSGTSVDGLDIAMCSFIKIKNGWKCEILKSKSVVYPEELRQYLLKSYLLSGINLKKLEIEFSEFCAKHINDFKSDFNDKIDLISSHGHTVFHQPENKLTMQIGSGEIIAKLCGISVISDFRSGDVALGGQGAPLVPIGDALLFGQYDSCLNLGGFSNISYADTSGKRIAFDISPVNIVLNELADKIGYLFDDKGKIAASGNVIDDLFEKLENIDYYKQMPPKSLSREWVEKSIHPLLDEYSESKIEDLLATFTLHTARRITDILMGKKNVLITGGGAYNDYLISKIKENTNTEIIIPEKELVDFKEAVVFAFLGLLRYRSEINCLSSVTGAKTDSCCGIISYPSDLFIINHTNN